MLYSDTIREEVRAELIAASPDGKIRVADVSKVCGERGKFVSEDDKQPFHRRAQDCNCRLQEALEKYYTENPEKKVEKLQPKKTMERRRRRRRQLSQLKDFPTPEGWWREPSVDTFRFSQRPRHQQEHPEKFADFNESL